MPITHSTNARAHARQGQSMLEYMALLVFLLATFFVFQHYIVRGFYGSWKQAGDAFGQGRQYDPRPFGNLGSGGGTLECFFDTMHCKPDAAAPEKTAPPCVRMNLWVAKDCYDKNCECSLPTEDPDYYVNCLMCIQDVCSELAAAGALCADPAP